MPRCRFSVGFGRWGPRENSEFQGGGPIVDAESPRYSTVERTTLYSTVKHTIIMKQGTRYHHQHNHSVSVPLGSSGTSSSTNRSKNGSGDGNDSDVSSLSDDKHGDHWKKSRPASFIVFQRLLFRFKMLPVAFQLVIAFVVGYILMTSIRQIMINSHRGGGYAAVVGATTTTTSSRAAASNYRLQHFTNEDMRPRILQLVTSNDMDPKLVMFAPLDHATSSFIPNKIPKMGVRELKEKYIELPDLHYIKPFSPAEELEKDNCHRLADWQVDHKPTCNSVHESMSSFDTTEVEMHSTSTTTTTTTTEAQNENENEENENNNNDDIRLFKNYQLVASGAFRQVFMIREYDGTRRALKTLRVDSDRKTFDLKSFDRHRRDAVSMDQLTSSPLVVDIYSYCTNSALFDWGEGGDLSVLFGVQVGREIKTARPVPSKETLLQIAYNVSLSLAHAHHPDPHGRATLAHTDIKPNQFLYQDGYYKLTDFNRVRFMTYDDNGNVCGFKVGKNGGIWRAPEEYAVRFEVQFFKVLCCMSVIV